jgi:hypothetical protein
MLLADSYWISRESQDKRTNIDISFRKEKIEKDVKRLLCACKCLNIMTVRGIEYLE